MKNRTNIFVDIFSVEARRFCLLAACLLFTVKLIGNNSITGKVIRVIDGDAIELRSGGKNHRVRLEGIDCPESGQALMPV